MITLVRTGLGIYAEIGEDGQVNDVAWVRDRYTEPREAEYGCEDCGAPIEEWELWTCLDGGEAAHEGCVTIHECEPAPGSVFDANRLWVTTAEQAAGKGRPPFRAKCRLGEHEITRKEDEPWTVLLSSSSR